MKNYQVKALINFNDMEEKQADGTDTPRKIGDTFYCAKERYEYLNQNKAVLLLGIDKVEEPKEEKKEVKKDYKESNKEVGVENECKMF